MIFLTPQVNEETRQAFTIRGLKKTLQLIEAHRELMSDLHPLIEKQAILSIRFAHDRDGNTYQNIHLKPSSSFQRNNEQWLTDGGIAINLTVLTTQLEELLEELPRALEATQE